MMEEWGSALNDTTYPAQRWEGWVVRLSRLVAAGNKVNPCPLCLLCLLCRLWFWPWLWQYLQDCWCMCTSNGQAGCLVQLLLMHTDVPAVLAVPAMPAMPAVPAMPVCTGGSPKDSDTCCCVSAALMTPLCCFQAAARALYKDEVYPDMITNHLRGGRTTSRALGSKGPPATVNSAFAAKWDIKFKDAFGGVGEKISGFSIRYTLHSGIH